MNNKDLNTKPDSMKTHLDACNQCVESAPHRWDLCEEGQRILEDTPGAEKDL